MPVGTMTISRRVGFAGSAVTVAATLLSMTAFWEVVALKFSPTMTIVPLTAKLFATAPASVSVREIVGGRLVVVVPAAARETTRLTGCWVRRENCLVGSD